MNAFYKTFLSKNEKYAVLFIKLSNYTSIPEIPFSQHFILLLQMNFLSSSVKGHISINALDPMPCCLPEVSSLAMIFLPPTSSFSLSTKPFPLDYKHAVISKSHRNTFSRSYFYPASVPHLCSLLQQNSSKEWCLLIFQLLSYNYFLK